MHYSIRSVVARYNVFKNLKRSVYFLLEQTNNLTLCCNIRDCPDMSQIHINVLVIRIFTSSTPSSNSEVIEIIFKIQTSIFCWRLPLTWKKKVKSELEWFAVNSGWNYAQTQLVKAHYYLKNRFIFIIFIIFIYIYIYIKSIYS